MTGTKTHDLGTQTVFTTIRANLSAKPLGRANIVSVIVRNPFTNEDLTPNVLTLLIGDGAVQFWEILPGSNSPEIFAADLKDLYIRVQAAVGEIDETDATLMIHRYPEPVRDVGHRRG